MTSFLKGQKGFGENDLFKSEKSPLFRFFERAHLLLVAVTLDTDQIVRHQSEATIGDGTFFKESNPRLRKLSTTISGCTARLLTLELHF